MSHHKQSTAPVPVHASAKAYLNQLSVGEMVAASPTSVYWANGDDPVWKGIDLLLDHKIQSIPLFDRKSKRFTVFLDLVDVVHFSSKVMSDQDIVRGRALGFLPFVKVSDVFEKATCAEVAEGGQPTGNAFVETSPHTKLRDVLATMVHSDFSYQRVPIVDQHNTLLGIVSQTRIIRECNRHINLFSFRSKRVDQIFPIKDVIGLDHNTSVSDALDLIKGRRITAVAIWNEKGKLVGNFSASDIKRYTLDLSNIIAQPLYQFLETVERPEGLGYPIAVVPSTTLEELFVKFEVSGVHRVFVVNAEGKAIGVISTKDIIRILLLEADGEEVETADHDAVMKRSGGVAHETASEFSESSEKSASHHHHHHHHSHHSHQGQHDKH